MIKALILDFGGVIVTMPPDAPSARAVAAELGLPVERLMDDLFGHEDWRQALVGVISEEEFTRRVHVRFGLPYSPDHPSTISRIFRDERLSIELLALADSLRGSLRIAMLSNASTALEEQLLRGKFNILDRFDLVINSARVGVCKPDPAIYQLTLERLGVAPEEAIFVDDLAVNVEAAAALGIHAIRFQNEAQAVTAIRQRLALDGGGGG
jgi:putative hydrolase of the HAD superfamily